MLEAEQRRQIFHDETLAIQLRQQLRGAGSVLAHRSRQERLGGERVEEDDMFLVRANGAHDLGLTRGWRVHEEQPQRRAAIEEAELHRIDNRECEVKIVMAGRTAHKVVENLVERL